MKVHMLNGMGMRSTAAQDYQQDVNGAMSSYPTPQTMVSANGNPLGNGGGWPGSNKANPYAHAQPGMYAGGSSLHGLGKPIMKMTVEEVISRVPELIKIVNMNPNALATIASFGESSKHRMRMPKMPTIPQTRGLGFGGFTDIVDDNEAYAYSQATGAFTDTSDEDERKFKAELFPVVKGGKKVSVSYFWHLMKIASAMISGSSVYVHKEDDGVEKTYENPRLTAEKHKKGRHPEYICIKTILESSNHPTVIRYFWVIDAQELDPDYALVVITAEEGPNASAANNFADEVYTSYHSKERTFLDKIWFDKKYGWLE